jgi:pimeloyl-ACP methyl ester carboxylesterase
MPELTLTLDQGTIRYHDEGTGPTVVFIHGALVDGRLWQPVVHRLRDRFRCVIPELPLGSHEAPMAPDADLSPTGLVTLIGDFLERLDLRDVTLVGNDTGGGLCQLLVTTRPERVGRLVLTNCDAFEDFPPAMVKPLVTFAKIPGALRVGLMPMRMRALRRLPIAYGLLSKRPIPGEVSDGWVLRALRDKGVMADLRKVLSGLDGKLLLDNAPRLTEFDKPVLIVWANEDKIFKTSLAHRLAAVFPDARVAEVGDAYTFVSWDQPDRVAELIGDFAAGQAAGSVAAGTSA